MSARIKDFASLAHHWGISEADRRRIIADKSKLLDETLERATAQVIAEINAIRALKGEAPQFPSTPQQREVEREAAAHGISVSDYLREQH